jgi:D-alanine-D-alanine ligase
MKVGLTYDLRKTYLSAGFSEEEVAEFDSDETIDFLEETIINLGYEVIRIGNIYELTSHISSGERWDLIFNLSEGLYGRSREAQVPALLEAYGIHYTFSDPLTLALCLDKAMAKMVLKNVGIPTPDFFTVDSFDTMESRCLKNNINYPLFVKPLTEGTGKGINTESVVRNSQELIRQCEKLLAVYKHPVLVEDYLPGREFTVGILGTGSNARVVGVMEIRLLSQAEPLVYSFANKEFCEDRVEYILVSDLDILREASEIALTAYKVLGCRDAGRIDLKADDNGRICFLEANPLAGLHPTHSDLPILCTKVGISFKILISEIIESALSRKDLSPVSKCFVR